MSSFSFGETDEYGYYAVENKVADLAVDGQILNAANRFLGKPSRQ